MGRSGNECRWNVNDPYSCGKKFPRILSLYYHCGTLVVFTPWSARRHGAKSQDTMFLTTSFVEPSGLDRQDGKRPDGLTLIPWHDVRSLVWDITVVSPLAVSYVDRAATDAGTVADMAATRKTREIDNLLQLCPVVKVVMCSRGGSASEA